MVLNGKIRIMSAKTVAIASDHAGFQLKDVLAGDLKVLGYTVLDLGTHGPDSVDYPDFGYAVGDAIATGKSRDGRSGLWIRHRYFDCRKPKPCSSCCRRHR